LHVLILLGFELLDGDAHAAVGHDHRADHVAGAIRGQECHDFGNFLGVGCAPDRCFFSVLGQIGLAISTESISSFLFVAPVEKMRPLRLE
jgi:hypothetical protein